MRKIIIFTLVLFLISCSVKATEQEAEQVVQKESTAVKKEEKKKRRLAEKKKMEKAELEQVVVEAQSIIANILKAMNENNYEAYIKDFNASMKSAYCDEAKFKEINTQRKEKYGLAGARPIKKIEKRNPFFNLYYLVKFSKVEKPVTVFMSLKRQEEKLKVAFLQFKFSEIDQ